jgi:aminoglycoside phosphotransferase (APT) family kinase protein
VTTIDLIDLDRLRAWLAGQGLPTAITDVRPLTGGSQNIVVRLALDGTPLVLRHPPAHPRPHSNRAIAREMRVLQALSGTDVPHPRFYAGTEDPAALHGAVFYLMAEVDGVNPAVELTPAYDDPRVVQAVGPAVAVAAARLGDLDPAFVGLGDLGAPGFLQRQIDRQLTAWEGLADLPGHDPAWLSRVPETADWLRTHLPTGTPPGLTHGDLHLSNLLLRRDRAEVAAIVDWEMCTVGDPLVDLAWLVLCWPGKDEPALVRTGDLLVDLPGMASRSEVVAAYAAASRRDTGTLPWYLAMVAFKFGIVVEGTYRRSLGGKASAELGAYSHDLARRLMVLADEVTRGRDPVAE